MVYLDKDTTVLEFPRSTKIDYESYKLDFVNQITHIEIYHSDMVDESTVKSVYRFSIDFADEFDTGQYDYYIYNNLGEIVATGILQYGEFVQDTTAYERDTDIISYNPNGRYTPTPKPVKTIDISENGEYDVKKFDIANVDVPPTPTQEKDIFINIPKTDTTVLPDDGYDLSKVNISVDVPISDTKSVTYTQNGTYSIDPNVGDVAMNGATVTVDVDTKKPEESKSVSYTANGEYKVEPTIGSVLSSVDVSVNVKPKLESKTITATENNLGVIVTPSPDYDGLSDAVVMVEIPTEDKSVTYTKNGTYTIKSEEGANVLLTSVDVSVNVPATPTQEKSVTISENGSTSVLPDDGYDLSKVDVNVNIPITDKQIVDITKNGEYTISPMTGDVALKYADVTVNVQPALQDKNISITENGTTTITKDDDYYGLNNVEITTNVQPKLESKTITATENNIGYVITPSPDYDGLSDANIWVGIPTEDKSVVISENGEYTIKSEEGDNVLLTSVDVSVNVPSDKVPTQEKDITIEYPNYTTSVTPDDGYDLSKVNITTNVPIAESKSVTISENGTTTVYKPNESYGMKKVIVTTNVQPTLQEKTATANGEITADSAYYGLSKVTVNVPSDKVPTQEKSITISENGTTSVLPDDGYDLSKVNVTTDVYIPTSESKSVSYTANGDYSILPETADTLSNVNVTVNVPISDTKSVTYTQNGTYTIEPNEGDVALSTARVTVDVDGGYPEESKSVTYTANGEYSVKPTSGSVLTNVDVSVNVPEKNIQEIKYVNFYQPETVRYLGPDSGYDGLAKIKVSQTFQEKTVDITENGTTEVTYDASMCGLTKVTINTNVSGGGDMFNFDKIGYDGTEQIKDDVAYSIEKYNEWVSTKTSATELYLNDQKLVYAPKIDTSNVTSMDSMFRGCYNLITVPLFDTSNVTNMGYMLCTCRSLTSVPLFDTSNVTNMCSMFSNCIILTSVPLFDTSKVEDMRWMFTACKSLTTIPLFETSNVKSMYSMFSNCDKLTTVPLFDTSNVTSMCGMFFYCSNLTSVPLFDTSKVEDMRWMFSECSRLTTIPLFDTSNVTKMTSMFLNCYKLTTVPLFDTSNVTDMTSMFDGCESLTTVGGFTNLGKAFTGIQTLDMSSCPLTSDSVSNIADTVYDMNSKSYTPTIKFSSAVYNALTDTQKTTFANKNWTITTA